VLHVRVVLEGVRRESRTRLESQHRRRGGRDGVLDPWCSFLLGFFASIVDWDPVIAMSSAVCSADSAHRDWILQSPCGRCPQLCTRLRWPASQGLERTPERLRSQSRVPRVVIPAVVCSAIGSSACAGSRARSVVSLISPEHCRTCVRYDPSSIAPVGARGRLAASWRVCDRVVDTLMTGFAASGTAAGTIDACDDTLVTGWHRMIRAWTAWIGCCRWVSSPTTSVSRWPRCTRGGIDVKGRQGSVSAGTSATAGPTSKHGSPEGLRTTVWRRWHPTRSGADRTSRQQ